MGQKRCFESNCVDVNEYVDEHTGKTFIRIRSTVTGTAMQCTPEEWRGFLADLGDGRWSHIAAKEAADAV